MTLKEYYKLSLSTKNKTLKEDRDWISYCCLGLSEIYEIKTAKTKDDLLLEFGDFMYCFVQIMGSFYGVTLEREFNDFDNLVKKLEQENRGLVYNFDSYIIDKIFILIEAIKKHYYHYKNKTFDIHLQLYDIFIMIEMMIISADFTMDKVLEANVNKLKERYPEGFKPVKKVWVAKPKHGDEITSFKLVPEDDFNKEIDEAIKKVRKSYLES